MAVIMLDVVYIPVLQCFEGTRSQWPICKTLQARMILALKKVSRFQAEGLVTHENRFISTFLVRLLVFQNHIDFQGQKFEVVERQCRCPIRIW